MEIADTRGDDVNIDAGDAGTSQSEVSCTDMA